MITGVSVGTLRTYWDRLRHRYEARSRSEVIAKALLKPPIGELSAFMLHKLPLFVWTVDVDGATDYRNEWFDTHSDVVIIAADSPSVCALMPPESAECLARHWREARILGEPFELLAELRCATNRELTDFGLRLHKIRALPIRNADGIVVKWIGYARELAEDADERMAQFLLSILKSPSPSPVLR